MKNVYSIKVVFGDTDAAGIVFYPNYYRWMDQATHELVNKAYMSVSQLQKEKGIILPLVETFCQFKSPLFFEDQVEVHSQVVEMKNKVIKVEHVFKKEDNIVASGYEIRAWASQAEGAPKAVSIPQDARAALGFIK